MPEPIRDKVFISYSHKDQEWLEKLRTMMTPLIQNQTVSVWWDGEIKPSQKWRDEIDQALESASVAVLLVSPNFLASEFIKQHELPYLLDAVEQQHVKLIWVLARKCLYDRTPIAQYQAAHDISKPLNSLTEAELDDTLVAICKRLEKAAAGWITPPPLVVAAQPEHLQQYYQDCIDRWSDDRYALDKRFVQLTLLLDQGEEAQGPRWQVSEKFQDLREVLERVSEPALVLLGAPGSGKSTLLRHFELECAQAVLAKHAEADLATASLTFFIPLNDYKARQPDKVLPPPKDWLAERWATLYSDLPPLDTLLQEKRLTLLLDALNEIPQADAEPIHLWKEFLQDLARDRPGNRVIFSCRSLDYSAPLSSKELPVPQVRIESLSDEQVQHFVKAYRPEYGETLWHNLAGTRQLELLRSPYYLKMLVEQTVAGEIPEGRAALFSGLVRQALRREIDGDNPLFRLNELLAKRDVQRFAFPRDWKTPYELPESGILFGKLSTLAFEMQTQRSQSEAAQIRIDYGDALGILGHERAEHILEAGVALGALEQDLGRDEVLYVHQLLQEYFAARRLAREPDPERVKVEWRVEQVTPSLKETLAGLADSDPLPPLPGTGWEETAVLAAAMTEKPDAFVAALMEANLALAGRCAAQPDVKISATLKDKIRWALVDRTGDTGVDLRARIAAGLALGELGDPRFEGRTGPYGEYLLPPLVEIPGGTYPIGNDEGLYESESPVNSVQLASFQIGKFPVTNAEWALFMKADGYEDERWWITEEDKAWRRGEGTAEGPKQQWRENREYLQDNFDNIREWHREGRITSKQAEEWEQIARMDDNGFEAQLEKRYPPGRQTQPAYWNDDAFNKPAQPVVGICWHEARAYCAWLSAQTGQPFRLPTEAEWEAAVRGLASRRYAYEGDFDAAHCNTFETHIRRTTPIGVFPGGETPEGLVDMTGNTYDWTSSLYQSYPYEADDGRENPAPGGARRVVRGGSWGLNRAYARAPARAHFGPLNRDFGSGVRGVCVAPILDR